MITVDARDVDAVHIAGSLAAFDVDVEDRDTSVVAVRFDSRTTRSGELIRALPPELPITDVAVVETSTESIVRRLYEGELDIVDDQ